MKRSLVSFFAFLMCSMSLLAQLPSSANCDLLVRVRTRDERIIKALIKVELLSREVVEATVHLNGDDSAQFQVINGRAYGLRVSGTGIETVSTPLFEINALEQSHTETVYVKPSRQNSSEESASGSPLISVSEMNIPKKASSEMNKGMEAYSKGDLEKAQAHFEKAIAEYPRYARAYDMLGAIAMKRSNRAKARDLFSKSIQTDATFLPAYVDMARMHLQEEDYLEAESLLAKAIAMNPSMPDAVALMATAEFANKEFDKALVDVKRSHALPNHEQFAELHIMAGKVLRMQNRPDVAILEFQLFLMERPNSPEGETIRNAIAALKAGQQP